MILGTKKPGLFKSGLFYLLEWHPNGPDFQMTCFRSIFAYPWFYVARRRIRTDRTRFYEVTPWIGDAVNWDNAPR